MDNQQKKAAAVSGVVVEALPNTLFRVKFENTEPASAPQGRADKAELLCYLAGKMRLHRIRVLVGDKVFVELDPYGGKGRIIKRV